MNAGIFLRHGNKDVFNERIPSINCGRKRSAQSKKKHLVNERVPFAEDELKRAVHLERLRYGGPLVLSWR
jgi:hypothetical protein